jgi:hypothetical protein
MILLISILSATAASATVNMIITLQIKEMQILMLKMDILDDETEEEDADVLLVTTAAARAASKVKCRWHPPLYL